MRVKREQIGRPGFIVLAALCGVAMPVHAGDGAATVAFGLDHVALGDAVLRVEDGALNVTALDDDGDDGVRIEPGAASGWSADIALGPAGALPLGATWTFAAAAVIDGAVETTTLRIAAAADGTARLDLLDAGSARTVTIELRRAGAPVDSVSVPALPASAIVRGAIGTVGDALPRVRFDRTPGPTGLDRAVRLTLAAPTVLALGAHPPVLADEVRVRTAPAATAASDLAITIHATGTPAFTLRDGALVHFDHVVRVESALRQVVDGAEGTSLRFGFEDVTSSAGIRLTPAVPVHALRTVDLAPVWVNDPVHTWAFSRDTIARFDDGSVAPCTSGGFLVGSCGCSMSFYVWDPAWGDDLSRLTTAWLDGALLAESATPGGAMFAIPLLADPDHWTVTLEPGPTSETATLIETWRWDEPITVSLYTNPVTHVTADEVRVRCEMIAEFDAGVPIEIVETHLGLAWGGASTMQLRGIVTAPTATSCTLDVDADGAVGWPEVIALLATWGSCAECPADLDENGAIDAADLALLLAAWGPCG